MLWLLVRPTGVCLLDFFCSGIQFYLLLSPCLSFVSLLCLGLCVLGDSFAVPISTLILMWIKTHGCFVRMKIPNSSMHHLIVQTNQNIKRR